MEPERSKAKVAVVGAPGVGKRSLVHRSAFDPIDDRYLEMGAKVSAKEIVLPVRLRDGTYVDLILWTLNPSAPMPLKKSLVRGVRGILAVCDATRKESLDNLDELIGLVYRVSGVVPMVLAINKCDIVDRRQIDPVTVTGFLRDRAADHFFTSAATGENVEAAFQALGEKIVLHGRAKAFHDEDHGPP